MACETISHPGVVFSTDCTGGGGGGALCLHICLAPATKTDWAPALCSGVERKYDINTNTNPPITFIIITGLGLSSPHSDDETNQ